MKLFVSAFCIVPASDQAAGAWHDTSATSELFEVRLFDFPTMDVSAFAEDLSGKLSDLGLGADALDEDTLEDFSPGSIMHASASVLLVELARACQHLGWPCPEVPASLDRASLQDFVMAAGFSMPRTEMPLQVDFLTTELLTCRFALSKRERRDALVSHAGSGFDVELGLVCKLLAIPAATEALRAHPERPLTQLKARLVKLVERLPPAALHASLPLLSGAAATPESLVSLREINQLLQSDYALRRQMLLQRLDVTVQSFLWSPRATGREADILAATDYKRRGLAAEPAAIRAEDAFTAGVELTVALSQRITDGSTRGLRYSSVKSVLIGAVPDRGGRVAEMSLSARDLMPAWSSRKAEAASGSGGGRGGGHGSRGGGRGPRPGSAATGTGRGGGGGSSSGGGDREARARALVEEAGRVEGEAAAGAAEEAHSRRGGRGGGRGGRRGGGAAAGGGGADETAGGGAGGRGRGRGR